MIAISNWQYEEYLHRPYEMTFIVSRVISIHPTLSLQYNKSNNTVVDCQHQWHNYVLKPSLQNHHHYLHYHRHHFTIIAIITIIYWFKCSPSLTNCIILIICIILKGILYKWSLLSVVMSNLNFDVCLAHFYTILTEISWQIYVSSFFVYLVSCHPYTVFYRNVKGIHQNLS